jgi:hypothetical protein
MPRRAVQASRAAAHVLAGDRAAVALVALFAVILTAGALGRVIRRPLWHDEIFTLYIATRSAADGLWQALATGVDLNPPLYFLTVRASAAIFGDGAVATRLPSMIGFLIASLAIHTFMRRRAGPLFALLSALTLPLSGTLMYSWEGRPYGLMLGFSAMGLLAWQRRGEPGSHSLAPLTCSLALASAVFTHYYSVLMVLPLAAGEAVRVVLRRRVDGVMWIALVAGTLGPLLALQSLLRSVRQYAATFWSAPTPDKLMTSYRELFDPLALTLVVALGCVAIATIVLPDDRGATRQDGRAGVLGFDELVAAFALVALPIAGYCLAMYTGAFHGRYVVQTVLGLAIIVGWSAATTVTNATSAALLVVIAFLAFSGRLAGGAAGLVRGPADPMAEHQLLLSVPSDGAPVAISRALDYLPLAHYSGSTVRSRLIFLTKPPETAFGMRTADRAIQLLAHYAPLDIVEFDRFVALHSRFYLYGRASWMVPALVARGAKVRYLGEQDGGTLYAIEVEP